MTGQIKSAGSCELRGAFQTNVQANFSGIAMAAPSAWHYTTSQRAQQILEDLLIRPATTFVPVRETPLVWFSRNQHWEPTASKATIEDGGIRVLTFKEMAELGAVRFGIDAARLTPWRGIPKLARMRHATVVALARSARKQGANPYDWCATPGPVPIEGLTFEVYEVESAHWLMAGRIGKEVEHACE